jgi:hypothetical protein
MGGLLIADTTLEFIKSRPPSTPSSRSPLWPNIIACIAFDTPYLGLHPYIFKNGVTKVAGYAEHAKNLFSLFGNSSSSSPAASSSTPLAALPAPPESSGGWNKWTTAYAVGGTLLAAGAAAGGYWRREDLSLGYNWATDHMKV